MSFSVECYPAPMSKEKEQADGPGSWIFKEIPRDLMWRAKAAASLQGKSVKALVIELIEAHLQELERKGILPKGK